MRFFRCAIAVLWDTRVGTGRATWLRTERAAQKEIATGVSLGNGLQWRGGKPSATWPTIDCEEQWRGNEKQWRVASDEKTKSAGERERRAGSKRPNLRPLHLTIRRRMVILPAPFLTGSERSESKDLSLLLGT